MPEILIGSLIKLTFTDGATGRVTPVQGLIRGYGPTQLFIELIDGPDDGHMIALAYTNVTLLLTPGPDPNDAWKSQEPGIQ